MRVQKINNKFYRKRHIIAKSVGQTISLVGLVTYLHIQKCAYHSLSSLFGGDYA